jgi:hypothetical protein
MIATAALAGTLLRAARIRRGNTVITGAVAVSSISRAGKISFTGDDIWAERVQISSPEYDNLPARND